VVKEGQGSAARVAFDPEGDFAEVHGEGILVHGVDAMGDDVADGFASLLGAWLVAARANPG